MEAVEYEELLAQIKPLDLSTLTRLEVDVNRLLQERQAENGGGKTIAELAAQAREFLRGKDREKYWAERERELKESRDSWTEREKKLRLGN